MNTQLTENIRTLASVEKISAITEIPGADKIDKVNVLGWQTVIGKNQFQTGDLCVFIQADSIVPPREVFSALERNKYRVKNTKIREIICQGFCAPLSILPEGKYSEGQDVTQILEIKKYEKPIPKEHQGTRKGGFPDFISKTKEKRIQDKPQIIEEMQNIPCYISQKQDGESATYAHYNDEIFVCSRTMRLHENEHNPFWKMFYKYNLDKVLKNWGNFAIQGELVGPNPRKGNAMGLEELELHVFNIYNIDTMSYLNCEEMLQKCAESGLTTVPILEKNIPFKFQTIEELYERSKGFYPNGKAREGIVIRSMTEQPSKTFRGGRMSFKVITPEYSLKND